MKFVSIQEYCLQFLRRQQARIEQRTHHSRWWAIYTFLMNHILFNFFLPNHQISHFTLILIFLQILVLEHEKQAVLHGVIMCRQITIGFLPIFITFVLMI